MPGKTKIKLLFPGNLGVLALLLITQTLLAAPSKPPLDFSRGAFGIMNAGTQAGLEEIPEAYFDYLKRLNMQWVAIGVTLNVANSVDSTVERFYTTDYDAYVPTFPDASIVKMAQQLHARGYKVLLSLALDEPWNEDGTANPNIPGKAAWRYQIGDPITPTGYSLAEWPWNPSHANHAAFVSSFWGSYTQAVIHYADICQQEGVEVFQLGAETQELFRTRAIGSRTNHFRTQIQAMVDSTRAHYNGQVAYYMHAGTWKKAYHNVDTLYHELWGDVGFDVIGGSIYGLVTPKTTVALNTLTYLKSQFFTIFSTYFKPVVQKYPTKTVAILELGIPAWNKSSLFTEPDGSELMNREDLNGNKVIDAEEVQSTMLEAYYFMADSLGYPQPGFLFGDGAVTDADAHLSSAYWGWGIRNHDAELALMRRFRGVTFTSAENTAPRLVGRSDSNYVVYVGDEFQSKPFTAVDDDTSKGDAILYRAVWTNYPWFGSAPSRGTVVGSPMDDDAGWWQAKVFAQDVHGTPSVDTAKFILWAIHPRSSKVTSVPPTTMIPGQGVNYQIKVVDGSGQQITTGLTYSLTVNPFFLSVNSSGKVTGMPTFQIAGTTRAAEVKITSSTAVYYDSWPIRVENVNDPPTWGGDGNLLDPKNGGTYSPALAIPFRVGYANDLNDDTLSFAFRVFGPGLDTSFVRKSGVISRNGAQKWDTAGIRFSLNLAGRAVSGQTYSWYVKVSDGRDTLTSNTWTFKMQDGVTALADLPGLPLRYGMGQGFWRADRRTFTIPIALPKAGRVSLRLYDTFGKLSGIIADGPRNAGYHNLSFDAGQCPGGMYFYKLEVGSFTAVRKMALIR